MGFQIGQKIGGYEFLRVLDTSGAGVTYEVQNEIAQRRELLKVLPRDLQEDRERVERFLREAKIHSHLSHDNIASFYSAMELDGQLVMTMEAVAGVHLEERLEEGPVSLKEAVKITAETLKALSYAHSQHVVHREITPTNLYLTEDGGVKLTGFGLAKQKADAQLTQPGMVMGSAFYMSPEQVKGSEELDGRSDLYSLGVVLYEMVAGSRPFDSKSQFEVIQAHVMTPPPHPSDLRAELPESLEQVILKSLEKDPEKRYQGADEFGRALEETKADIVAAEGREKPQRPRGPIDEARVSELDAVQPAVESPPIAAAEIPETEDRQEAAEPEPAERPELSRPPDIHIAEPEPIIEAEPVEPSPEPVPEVAPPAAEPALPASVPAPPAVEPAAAMSETPGWTMKDLVIVGTLTFIMVVALFMAAMIIVEG